MATGYRDVEIGQSTAKLTQRTDGTQLLEVVEQLPNYPDTLIERLDHWASVAPDRVFVAQRNAGGEWESITYRDTLNRVRSLSQVLLDMNLRPERPLAILSGNSTEHLLLALAAMYVGIPYAPLSPAYCLISKDFGKAKYICELLTPGAFFVDNTSNYGEALSAIAADDAEVIALNATGFTGAARTFNSLVSTPVTDAVDQAHSALTPDTIAKFLFTSGSTGMPKGVINTNRMLASNQEMLAAVMPFLKVTPPVLLDWLPWNHTFGGNHNVGIVLYNGGTLYIDDGKPTPALFERTICNLQEISPTVYFNVPKGFELLADRLEQDDALRDRFFRDLNLMFFAGAGLAQHVWDKLDDLAIKSVGAKVGMLTGLGATETAPSAMFASLEESQSGVIGLPALGVSVKLVPNGGKLECRVKGPNVMPGYWRQPEVNAKVFDEEGFYCLGDAAKFIDPSKPQRGMKFDGRISEDFKLNTGTWVSVGPLRARIIEAGAPVVQDVVIAGLDQAFVSAMVFPEREQCRILAGLPSDAEVTDVVSHPAVIERFEQLLRDLKTSSTGSSNRVDRLTLLTDLPRLDAHEITDKGSINQRAVLENRAQLVEELYQSTPSSAVIKLTE